MVVKLSGFFWKFTSFFNGIGEIYSVMPKKMMKKIYIKIIGLMKGMSSTRGPRVFEKNDLSPQEDLFVLRS